MATMEQDDEEPDPYEVLGVDEGADRREIRRAYRRMALEVHPDRNRGDEGAAALFIRVTRAYEALADEGRRKAVDARRAAGAERRRRREAEGARAREMREALERREREADARRAHRSRAQRAEDARRQTAEAVRRMVGEGSLRPPGGARPRQQPQPQQPQQPQQQLNAVFVHWPESSTAAGLPEDALRRIFGVYGEVARVAHDAARHRALLEFRSEAAALEALDHEGVSLTVSLATRADVEASADDTGGTGGGTGGGLGALEESVLARLRAADAFPAKPV